MDELSDADDDIPFSDYDPDAKAWFANLLFWRPSRFSDEEMQLHFGLWDGRWSAQTKRAMLRLKAEGLDLNENWALSSSYSICPACRRSKDDIFRLSKRGILLAKLELHHDHIRDYVWPRMRELFGTDWLETRPKSSAMLLDQIRELTSRFDVCLVCSECNAADGKVKIRFSSEIDPRFSFSAQEIGTFVRPTAGSDHEISYEKAYAAWEAEKGNFQTRVLLLDELLGHVAHGRLARDHQGMAGAKIMNSAFDGYSLLMRSFDQDTKNTERAQFLWRLRDEFLARSTSRDSATLAPADPSRRPVVVAPTDDEYAAYVDPVSPKRWLALSPNWVCPICARNKRQLLRKSKSGKWSGGVRSHEECILERDDLIIANRRRLFPDFRNDIFVRDITQITVCADCAGISAALMQKDQSIRDPHLSIGDRCACILNSEPHSAHEIDFEVARQRARTNESYAAASDAFLAFRGRVRDFAGRFERGRRWGETEKDLLAEFVEDLRVFHRVDNRAECLSLAKWLLMQDTGRNEGSE
ncbi:rubredoxin [Bradyrhizobium elkanii]|nr:rubredoxin [Bradyrhizobium elkanii]